MLWTTIVVHYGRRWVHHVHQSFFVMGRSMLEHHGRPWVDHGLFDTKTNLCPIDSSRRPRSDRFMVDHGLLRVDHYRPTVDHSRLMVGHGRRMVEVYFVRADLHANWYCRRRHGRLWSTHGWQLSTHSRPNIVDTCSTMLVDHVRPMVDHAARPWSTHGKP